MSLSDSSDYDLICLLKHGDEEAFIQLYRRYYPRLTSNLLRLLKDPNLVEEVLQDIFLTIWEKRAHLDPDQSISAYLYTLAANRSKNLFRRMGYDHRMRVEVWKNMQAEERRATQPNMPDYPLEQKEIGLMLDNLLQFLTPQQFKVYKLCKLEGYSYQEAAKKLAISETTVNTHIRDANKLLRKQVKGLSGWEFILFLILISHF